MPVISLCRLFQSRLLLLIFPDPSSDTILFPSLLLSNSPHPTFLPCQTFCEPPCVHRLFPAHAFVYTVPSDRTPFLFFDFDSFGEESAWKLLPLLSPPRPLYQLSSHDP